MKPLTKKAGALSVLCCGIMVIAAECPGPDYEARDRLDSLEAWAHEMAIRVNQNIWWADTIHKDLWQLICNHHGTDPGCAGPVVPPDPPDSIPPF